MRVQRSGVGMMIATAMMVGWALVALVAVWRLGVFRGSSVVGPDRTTGANLLNLSGLGLIGFCVWAVAVGLAGGLAGKVAPGNTQVFVAAGALATALTAGLLLLLRQILTPPPPVNLPEVSAMRGLLIGVAGVAVVLPWVWLTLQATLWLRGIFGDHDQPEHDLLRMMSESGTVGMVVVTYLSAAVVTPIFEEVLFRGVMQTFWVGVFAQGLGVAGEGRNSAGSRWGAIVMTSALFALLHAGWSSPAIFVLSLGLGYVYERTGRLWPVIVMHALFNALSITLTLVGA